MVNDCFIYGIITSNSSSFKAINSSCSWANIVLTFPTIFVNLALAVALATSREKRRPCTLLLLNLTVTDFLTGLVSMPSYFYVFRLVSSGKYPCRLVALSAPFAFTIGGTSFMTVSMIAMERYISVFHPYFHAAKLTFGKTLLFIGIAWILPGSFVMPSVVGHFDVHLNLFIAIFPVSCVVVTIFCYLRILLQARKVRLQIQNQEARLGQRNTSITDRRYVSVGGLIVVSMIVCFSPIALSNLLWFMGVRNRSIKEIRCWEWTLVMANSSINPVITCSFCPPIRWRVLELLTCRLLFKKPRQ